MTESICTMDGRKIKSVSWQTKGDLETLTAGNGRTFEISVDQTGNGPYEGEALVWVVQKQDDKEIQRFNVKYVDTIEWAG